jgi:hypothetical protein
LNNLMNTTNNRFHNTIISPNINKGASIDIGECYEV